MRLSDLDIDKRVIEILRSEGINELYPPQAKAIPYALKGDNLLLCAGTAAGKTLVAYLAILDSVLLGGRAVYIVPLKALATEKYEELKKFESLGIRTTVTTSDYDRRQDFSRYDVVVCTSERIDSLMRRKPRWIEDITVVIADEVHLLNDHSRGPTLEIVLTRFKLMSKKIQILALSATIGNPKELASWLDARAIVSDFRPVSLHSGVFSQEENNTIFFKDGKEVEIPFTMRYGSVGNLVLDCLENGGQSLVFVNTRRSAQSEAKKLALIFERKGIADNEQLVEKINGSDRISSTLKKCVRAGTAFHTAELDGNQRKIVEESFKKGLIKCICATPTLAFGVNLPARRVIIRDTKRYQKTSDGFDLINLPVLEVRQMEGRAGRPGYDEYGESIIVEKTSYLDGSGSKENLFEHYINADVEELTSKLSNLTSLRSHTLSLIATKFAQNMDEIMKFYKHTFLGHIELNEEEMSAKIEEILNFLEKNEFIKFSGKKIKATMLGTRISTLYIDPFSAVIIKNALERAKEKVDIVAILHGIAYTPDVRRLRFSGDVDMDKMEELNLLMDIPEEWDENFNLFFSALKTAYMLRDWVNEINEDSIVNRFKTSRGDINAIVQEMRWMLYAAREIDKLLATGLYRQLKILEMRVRYGVKEELLELCSLRGIGRIRARALFDHNIKNLKDINSASVAKLKGIEDFGDRLARSVKKQAEELV
jgi:helicase